MERAPGVCEARDDVAVSRAPDGDGHASPTAVWEHVYAEWRLPVLRYVHRLTGDPHLAEDVAHEAFLRLLSTPGALTGAVRAPGAWLFRVAGNLVRDAGRRLAIRARAARHVELEAATPERPDEALERAETSRAVRAALDALGARDREVLLMREAGLAYDEIATALGIQPQSVPSVVMRALRRFRKAYEGRSE